MDCEKNTKKKADHPETSVSDRDIYDAMKDIPGYIDITPGDFKEIYQLAYTHALKRSSESVRAKDVMTQKVLAVKRTTPVEDVADQLALNGISGPPVVENDGREKN